MRTRQELIKLQDTDPIDIDEMVMLITEYINEVKGRKVQIAYDAYNPFNFAREVQLIHLAYEYALYYFRNGHTVQNPV